MKKNVLIPVLFFCVLIIIGNSCKKNEEKLQSGLNISKLLAAHSWTSQVQPNIIENANVINGTNTIFQNITVLISANGTYSISSSNDLIGNISSGPWLLTEEGNYIKAVDGKTGRLFLISIIHISDDSLQIEFIYNYSGIIEATFSVKTMCSPI